MTLSMGFRSLVSLLPTIQATRLLAFALAGLSPAERASLNWTHSRSPFSPSDIYTVASGHLHRQDSHLLEWQLASLHEGVEFELSGDFLCGRSISHAKPSRSSKETGARSLRKT